MTARPVLGFDIESEIERQNKLYFRGNAYPVDTESFAIPPYLKGGKVLLSCPCKGSGKIYVGHNGYGMVSEICKCPAGDADRKYIDREEQRLRQDERNIDMARGESSW
jgi:hypothetical protein